MLIQMAISRAGEYRADRLGADAKITTLHTAMGQQSFDDAIKQGIKRADETLDKIQGAWVNEMKLKVEDGEISEYRVNLKVTFVLKD